MENLSDIAFRDYLERFHSALEETAKKYLAGEFRGKLLHLSYLPARIVGYVSTSFGVAWEYIPQNVNTLEIRTGDDRVEDLFFGAPAVVRETEPLLMIGGPACGLYDGTLEDAFPFRLAYRESSIHVGSIQARSKGWSRIVRYAELYGDNRPETWSAENAVSRAKDEILAAMVEIRKAEATGISLVQYISKWKEKTILVLGSYASEGEARLRGICQALYEMGYNPITVKDIPDEPHQNLDQKMQMLGSLSRFVVVDDTDPSGHLKEIKICEDSRWVTVMLRAYGKASSYITRGSSAYSSVVLEKEYSPEDPKSAIQEAAKWAEGKLAEMRVRLDREYPWRS